MIKETIRFPAYYAASNQQLTLHYITVPLQSQNSAIVALRFLANCGHTRDFPRSREYNDGCRHEGGADS